MLSATTKPTTRLVILVLPEVHLLDLAGPVQVFSEAADLGAPYELCWVGVSGSVPSAQGVVLGGLRALPEPRATDLVLVPGVAARALDGLGGGWVPWLRAALACGARVASVCSGSFALGKAGLLDGRTCTTHWALLKRLQRAHPRARVVQNRLFVKDRSVITSAGIASGIDMALSLLEDDRGPLVVAKVAREMVVYLRREGDRGQESVFLNYRTHLHPGVHRVQDWLVCHPERRPTLQEMGQLAGLSARQLTRVFRKETGITPHDFAQRVKLEVARDLLRNSTLKVEAVAAECGFADGRQLRRLWRQAHGTRISRWRETVQENARKGA